MTTIAVIAALKEEIPNLRNAGDGVVGAVTGVGREVARRVMREVLEASRPDAVLSLGYGGGLREGLTAGALALSPSLHCEGEPTLNGDRLLLEAAAERLTLSGISYELGDCVTVDGAAWTVESKAALGQRTGAAVVDMESYWIAWEAQAAGLPWLALRAVVDPVDRALPPFVAGKEGRGVRDWVLPALGYALTTPSGIPNLVRLGLASGKARRSLKRGSGVVLPALAASVGVTP